MVVARGVGWRRSGAILAAFSASLCAAACTAAAERPAPDAAALRLAEVQIVELLADHRTAAGLPPLARGDALDEVARKWSQQLAATGEARHNPAYATEIPAGWSVSGENVGWADPAAYPLAELPASLHEGWLASPTHRANMDDPAYTTVGVGVAFDEANGFFVTANFAAYP